MLKRTVFTLFACTIALLSFGQLQADIQTPKIVPPSPDAAALGKYGEIPVDKSVGVPQISIPMYEIKTPRFSLPISLSYHASGIKVEEVASWVGAGWSLNAGGVITRSIIGIADDAFAGYINQTIKKASTITWPGDRDYISDVINKRIDTDPDNFFYNFNTQAGSFVFGDDKKPNLIPYKPIKVNFNTTSKNFDITDEQGNTYFFSTKEYVTSSIGSNQSGISSWYLTQMVSADRSDTVNFNYTTDVTAQTQYSFNFTQPISSDGTGPYALRAVNKSSSFQQFNPVRISSIVFKGGKVEFIAKSGRLDEANMSLDSVIVYNQNIANNQYSRIKSFKLLTDYFYNTAWSIPSGFFITIPEADNYRLKLTGLQENDAANGVVKTHQFDYNSTVLPWVHCMAQDKWGYFNGQTTNQTLLETRTIVVLNGSSGTISTIGSGEGADRSVSESYMQAGVLTKITYPTKGYTTFSYECNKKEAASTTTATYSASAVGLHVENATTNYTPTGDMIASGGTIFRVRLNKGDGSGVPLPSVKIVRVSDAAVMYTLTANPSALIDTYVYVDLSNVAYQLISNAEGGTSVMSSNPPLALISTSCQVPDGGSTINVGGLRIKSIKNYNSDGAIAGTQTFYYGKNNESGGGTELAFFPVYHYSHSCNTAVVFMSSCTFPGGYIDTYMGTSYYPGASLNGSPVAYPTVKVYQGDSLANIGKSIYKYTPYPDSIYAAFSSSGYGGMVKPISVSWKNGEPIWEGHYRNDGSNVYTLVQETTNTYTIIGRKPGIGSIIAYLSEPIGFNFDSPSLRLDGHVEGGSSPCGSVIWEQWHFSWYDYPIPTGSKLLTQSVTNTYAPDGIAKVQTTTNYYYDNTDLKHVFPTRIQTTTSTGDTRLKQISYPQDMVNAGTDPTGIYASMVTANMVSSPVVITESKNSTQLLKTKNNYALFNSTLIEQQSVEVQNKSNTSETRLQYLSYDSKGNPQSVVKDDGPKVSYQWGYKGLYPVAMALNTTSNNIFYENFEDGNGNGVAEDDKTGHFSHTGSYSKALTGLDNGSYILTYWQKTSGVWSMTTTPVTVSTTTYTISLSAQVDDICFYPATAQLTTYRYDPLIGVTSQTDPNGIIAYYYYDSFNRLAYIRDKDYNVIKKFCYNYAGQAENCTTASFTNVVKSGVYTRNNCSSGTGSSVTYTVAPGTYSSFISQADADQQAQNDVNSNGQNYANSNGGCTVSCSFSSLSGFGFGTNSISTTSGTTTFSLALQPSGTMNLGTEYMVVTISTGCRPTANRTMTLFSGTRSFFVTIYAATGQMGVRTISGSSVPGGTVITLAGSYAQ